MSQYDAKDVNTMKKLKLCILAVKIEWHWWFIRRTRKKGNSLLSHGMPYSSQKLYRLNKQLSAHSAKALAAQGAYEKLLPLKK